jgi:hypothetical protein
LSEKESFDVHKHILTMHKPDFMVKILGLNPNTSSQSFETVELKHWEYVIARTWTSDNTIMQP